MTDTKQGSVTGNCLFNDLDDAEREQLGAILRPFRIASQEVLFRQGAPVDRLYLPTQGRLALHTMSSGTTVPTAVLGPASVLGESALVGPATHPATAVALETVTGFELDAAEFRVMLRLGLPLARKMLGRLAAELCARVRRANGAEGDARAASRTPHEELRSVRRRPADSARLPLLRGCPFFARIADEDLAELLATMTERALHDGELVFAAGDPGDALLVVAEGIIDVSVSHDGQPHRLATLAAGKVFGEVALVDGGARTATCTALGDSVLLELRAEALDEYASLHLEVLEAVVANLIAVDDQLLRARTRRIVRHGAPGSSTPTQSPDLLQLVDSPGSTAFEGDALVALVCRSVIGDDLVLPGPFGPKRIVYADYTASGRSLSFIEEFIQRQVLPLYANTHTESSATGRQTMRLRDDARRIVHEAVGGSDDDVVLFCGSGATAAIDKVVRALGLRIPERLDEEYRLSAMIPPHERPVIFIGPYEHHSNELVWRESIADVRVIREDHDGRLDLEHLRAELEAHAERPLRIGSFSAASNVTGIITDTDAVATLLHQHDALSFWDYAAAGPYLDIRMNPEPDSPDGHLAYKDAVFISPHKFIGGPGTPGLLVAKRGLFNQRVPTMPGGGTVAFVTTASQCYLAEAEHREESGTPAIVESIRCGLVFQLKSAVGAYTIREREEAHVQRAIRSWSTNPNIEILGNTDLPRLSIVSLGIRHPRGMLHPHFIVSVLNDLFGIQARGGCFCAGPYLQRLSGIGENAIDSMLHELQLGREGAKLGWFRINFNYFVTDAVTDYIIDAVEIVAHAGHKLLPLYRFDPFTGLWRHRAGRTHPAISLHDITYTGGEMGFAGDHATAPRGMLAAQLDDARRLVARLDTRWSSEPAIEDPSLPDSYERMRWFPLPGEALDELRS